jgi:uncharacterized SAM-binding protein YcdF (DUF218 family)
VENSENEPNAKGSSIWREVALSTIVPITFAAIIVAVGGISHGKPLVEKLLRGFAMPCGIIWLGLLLSATLCFVRRQRMLGLLSVLLFVLHSTFGGEIFSSWLCETLESPYEFVNLATFEHVDAIIVLGGGVKTSGDYTALTAMGDRIFLALRLYHAGKTDRLVFTGAQYSWANDSTNIATAAASMATEFGVPESAIETSRGRNTYEEFQLLKAKYGDRTDVRIGVLTSATHLPRAIRLAKSVGVDMIPIPADFEREDPFPLIYAILPGAGGYQSTERACVEYLARLVGR